VRHRLRRAGRRACDLHRERRHVLHDVVDDHDRSPTAVNDDDLVVHHDLDDGAAAADIDDSTGAGQLTSGPTVIL
jgi:hypothetical protein